MSWKEDTDYRIGFYPDKCIALPKLGIAVPDQVTWQGASQYYARSDLSKVGDGFAIVTWVWDMISYERLARLLEFLQGKESNEVYIHTDIRDGTFAIAANAFNVYKVTMWKPLLFGQDGEPVVRTAMVYQTVQVKFVNAVLQTGYL